MTSENKWKVKSSTITFKIKNAGLTVDGFFKGLEAEINFDANKPENCQITASIDVTSINTNNSWRDNHLRGSDYFDAKQYPKILMKSKKITKSNQGEWLAYFTLTIKGISKEIQFPFKFTQKDKTAQFEGNFTINRRDFGVGGGSLILSNQATVFISVSVQQE